MMKNLKCVHQEKLLRLTDLASRGGYGSRRLCRVGNPVVLGGGGIKLNRILNIFVSFRAYVIFLSEDSILDNCYELWAQIL
jgi:hypothetical protein